MKKDGYILIFTAVLAFVFPFIVYFITANPYLTFTDNGELMGVCVTLGIAHPTGYPLFAILGYLWSLLPLSSSKIFQMNLLASVWTAFASVFFFFASLSFFKILYLKSRRKIDEDKSGRENIPFYFLALISALTFAFARTIWGEATSLEVYSLQLLLFNLILFISFEFVRKEFDSKLMFPLLFFVGLAFTNHLTTILIVPSILYLIFFRDGKRIQLVKPDLKSFLLLLLPFLVGLSVYLYLPIRSSQFPLFNWGWVSRSLDKFIYHVSGKQYRVWMFSSSETISENFNKFVSILPFEFAFLGLVIVLVGFIYLLFKNRYLLYFLFLLLFSCLFYALNYQIHDIETYFSIGLISLFLMFAAGLFYFWLRLRYYSAIAILVPIFLIFLNFKENDDSENNLVVAYTKNVVDNLEPNAVIISAQWDYFCSAFWYLQKVEGYRKDIVLIEKELLRRTWYLEQLRRWYPEVIERSKNEIVSYLQQLEKFESEQPYDANEIQLRYERLLQSFIEKNIDERPVYITFDILQNEYDRRPFLQYEQIPQGFAIRLLRENREVATDFSKLNVESFTKFRESKNHLIQGIKQAALTNLIYLENYNRLKGNVSVSNSLMKIINKLQE